MGARLKSWKPCGTMRPTRCMVAPKFRSRPPPPSRIPAQYLGGHTGGSEERATHAFAVSKTRFLRHDANRMPSFLQHEPGGLQPKLFYGFCRRLTGLSQKGATELAGAEIGDGREFLDRERVPEVLADVRQDQLD